MGGLTIGIIELFGCSVEYAVSYLAAPIRLRLYQFGPIDFVNDVPPGATGLTRLTVEAPEEVELVTLESGGDQFVHDRRDGTYASAQLVVALAHQGVKGYLVVSEEPV